MTRKHAQTVSRSFAGGVAAAIAAALLLDWLYFERAVDAREGLIRGRFRILMQHKDDYYYRRFCDDSQMARERAEADAQAQYANIEDRLNRATILNVTRQKMLDAKNEELRTYARSGAEIFRLENNVKELEAKNERLRGQLDLVSNRETPTHIQLAVGRNRRGVQSSESLAGMRAEFARQLAAEAEGRKKPKGPVYLNTPRGRVILVPAG